VRKPRRVGQKRFLAAGSRSRNESSSASLCLAAIAQAYRARTFRENRMLPPFAGRKPAAPCRLYHGGASLT
jgi:hypothetical protein